MPIKALTDPTECQAVYQQLCDHRSWYDNWDIRWTFNQAQQAGGFPLHFITFEIESEPVSLLPLQYNVERKRLEFFGGRFFEANHAYGLAETHAALFRAIDQTTFIDSLIEYPAELADQMKPSEAGPKYTLDLTQFNSKEEFLGLFDNKFRKNRNYEFRKLEQRGITKTLGSNDDVALMIEMNLDRFGAESSYHHPGWRKGFLEMVQLPYDWQVLRYELGGELIGVQVSTLYEQTYMYHNMGGRIFQYPGLGWYMILQNIFHAKELGATIFDSGTGDLGWKKDWHHQPTAQFTYSA